LSRRPHRSGDAERLDDAAHPTRVYADEPGGLGELWKVAGSILEWTEQNHPEAVQQTTAEINAFFAELPSSTAAPADEFVPELRAALPRQWADKAEAIWRAHARRRWG
jgi:hypothetical protein